MTIYFFLLLLQYTVLCVRRVQICLKGVLYLVTHVHDGQKIRQPYPAIKVKDTVKFDIATGRIKLGFHPVR